MSKLRVFVSSVQKELEHERAAVATVISTDPFLLKHCEAVLFEQEALPPHPTPQPYLGALKNCSAYLLIIAQEYGPPDGDLSATHHEYRLAQEKKLPTLVFIKGKSGTIREAKVEQFIKEITAAKHTYRRFHDREDLKPEVQRALIRTLKDDFGIEATPAEVAEGAHLIDIASSFEARIFPDILATEFTGDWLHAFASKVLPKPGMLIYDDATAHALTTRGLATFDPEKKLYHATAAAVLLFGARPADRFPQVELLLDAYDSERVTGRPRAQENLNLSLPEAVTATLAFIDRHTGHPRRVVGVNNLRLDEYPGRALREAVVNAVAHRNYDDAARKISVRIFSNRIEIASPGYPPKPLTLAKLRKGNYRPASRNPLIAQALSSLQLMEQRGSGFARMRDAMLDHGLDEPLYVEDDGYFIATFPGPNGQFDRIKVTDEAKVFVTPATEAQLNARQKKIMLRVQKEGVITSGWCRKTFKVSYNTAYLDLTDLMNRGLLIQIGKGRSTRYELKIGN